MTSRTLTLLTAAVLGVAGIASAQMAGQTGQASSDQPDRSQSTMDQPGQAGQAGQAGQMGQTGTMSSNQRLTDKDFVKQAASSDQYEVDAAKLVQDKVKDPQIKQLAKTMESDHKQSSDELKRLAKQANISDIPSSPQGQDQQMLSQLKQANDQQLGQQYVQQQIQAHEKAIQLFRQAQTQVQDPQLKSFAERTLPKLEQHLQHLQQIGGGAQPAGGALQGTMDKTQSGIDTMKDKAQTGADRMKSDVDKPLDQQR
jgi:putative membrane protein